MDKDELLNIFNKNTIAKKHIEATKVIENDLIVDTKVNIENNIINISANIISDSLISTYLPEIEIDLNDMNINKVKCTCDDYEKFEFVKKNYCCKHIIAAFYSNLDKIIQNLNQKEQENQNILMIKENKSVLDSILEENNNEILKLSAYVEFESLNNSFKLSFKVITNRKEFVIRDLKQFLVHYDINVPLKLSNEIEILKKNQEFDMVSLNAIHFIESINKIDINFIKGKFLKVPEHLSTYMFNSIKGIKTYLSKGFYLKDIEGFILNENPNLQFYLEGSDDGYHLILNSDEIKNLSYRNDIIQISNSIYLPDNNFIKNYLKLMKVLFNTKIVEFKKNDEEKIFKVLIPILKNISSNIKFNKYIENKIIDEEPNFKFYLDMKRNILSLTVNVVYKNIELNLLNGFSEKFIYRRDKVEKKIISMLLRLGFKQNFETFELEDENKIFLLFKRDIQYLQKEGEVFYSDKVKGIKKITSSNIKIDITKGKFNYFDFAYSIEGLDFLEIQKIIKSFKNNTIFYKLKNGEYLDLEQLELKQLTNLLNLVNDKNITKDLSFSINKASYTYLNDILMSCDYNIKGFNVIKETKKLLNNIEKEDIQIDSSFKGVLREYQKIGVKWFQAMTKIGGGGILADDMGLGKTIQTIAFINNQISTFNEKKIKIAIIAPTSLIYNWKSEIEKFTNLKYKLIIGSKNERKSLIENIDNEIILTTYGYLKNDINEYKSIKFDFVFLDEAQNIKNSKAQITKALKKLDSKNRFALTGTPIENSLTELWSIFDFVLPGYLKKESEFNSRYVKGLKENKYILDELSKLTKPFILRRLKEDVAKELPEKIEKNILISLDGENKKVYGIYSKNIQNLIEKKESLDLNYYQNKKIEILAHLTKLRQLCLCPGSVIDGYNGNYTKIDTLMDIVDKSLFSNRSILIFSQFTSSLKYIANILISKNINYSYLDGSLSLDSRNFQVANFKNKENNIFLISTKAGGVGLNLIEADMVIHFDPWWNPAVEDQATDRAHRIGQNKVVEVIRLIAKDTIEEKIIDLHKKKRELIENVLNNDTVNLEFNDFIDIIKHR